MAKEDVVMELVVGSFVSYNDSKPKRTLWNQSSTYRDGQDCVIFLVVVEKLHWLLYLRNDCRR